jgi:hypothetical protein
MVTITQQCYVTGFPNYQTDRLLVYLTALSELHTAV